MVASNLHTSRRDLLGAHGSLCMAGPLPLVPPGQRSPAGIPDSSAACSCPRCSPVTAVWAACSRSSHLIWWVRPVCSFQAISAARPPHRPSSTVHVLAAGLPLHTRSVGSAPPASAAACLHRSLKCSSCILGCHSNPCTASQDSSLNLQQAARRRWPGLAGLAHVSTASSSACAPAVARAHLRLSRGKLVCRLPSTGWRPTLVSTSPVAPAWAARAVSAAGNLHTLNPAGSRPLCQHRQ